MVITVKFKEKKYFLTETIFTDCLEKGCYSICWEGVDEDGEDYHIYGISPFENPKISSDIEIDEVVHLKEIA